MAGMGFPLDDSYYNDPQEQTVTTENHAIADMLEAEAQDCLIRARQTSGIDQAFWLAMAKKLA